ncbi:MAG: DHA2 family efflux MFS transporter permease subunit [Bryobacteraceae bacterium]
MSAAVIPFPVAPAVPRVNPWIIAIVVTMATFMEVLDTTIVNVSLPHIAGNLSAGVDESTWVLTSYLVSNAIILPLSGWFSMLLGRKRFYITCVAIFTVSSILCGMAASLGMLVVFRIIQGLGGGGLQPTEQAILVDTFPPEKRGMSMAVYGVAVVAAPVIGPTLGGWITDNYNWRWIFFMNVPIGLLSMMLSSRLLSDPPHQKRDRSIKLKIDFIGIILVSLGLGFMQIVLDKGQTEDWFQSNFIVICATLAAVGLLSAVFWELKQKDPVVDLTLFKDRTFLVSTSIMFVLGFVLYGSSMLLPLFAQSLLGYTAMLSGMVLSPGGIVIMFMMPLVALLLKRIQARFLIMSGLFIIGGSLFWMARFNLGVDFGTLVWARIFQASGLAFMFIPINVAAFAYIPKNRTNNATGLINLGRNTGASVGIALATTLLARREQLHQTNLVSHLTPLDGRYQQTLDSIAKNLVQHGATASDAAAQAPMMVSRMVQQQASMLSFADAFWLLGVICFVVAPFVLLIKKNPPQKGPVSVH